MAGGKSLALPIAPPAARPPWIEVTGGAFDVPRPSTVVLSFRSAMAHAGPPIEEGERCHICDLPAVVEQVHIAWCSSCACALLTWRNVSSHGPTCKAAYSDHAVDHAFRWHRLVRRLGIMRVRRGRGGLGAFGGEFGGKWRQGALRRV